MAAFLVVTLLLLLVFGAVGFAVHALWLVALVCLLALILGPARNSGTRL
jgi:hypothetical protein